MGASRWGTAVLLPFSVSLVWLVAGSHASESRQMQRLGIDRSGDRTLINIRCFSGEECAMTEKLVQGVETNVRRIVDLAYQGQQPDFKLEAAADSSQQVPICNRQGGFFGEENDQNHLNENCGASFCQVELRRVCLVCGRKECNFRPVWGSLAVKQETCEKERAWKRGALIQQVYLSMKEVNEEIRAGVLYVGPRCASALGGKEMGNLVDTHTDLSRKWLKINGGRVFACDLQDESQKDAEVETFEQFGYFDNDRRVPRQAACTLNGAIHALQLGLAHMAVCEAFARAEHRWQSNLLPIIDAIVPQVAEEAAEACFSMGRVLKKEDQVVADPACINPRYQSAITAEFDKALSGLKSARGVKPQAVVSKVEKKKLVAADGALVSCPEGTPDCKQCRDPIFCGSGSAFSRAELASVAGAIQDLRTARANLSTSETLLSQAAAVDLDWLGPPLGKTGLACSKWLIPDADRKPAAVPSPGPSGYPSPSPSPDPSAGRPSPDPSPGPSPSPRATPSPLPTDSGVTVIIFTPPN